MSHIQETTLPGSWTAEHLEPAQEFVAHWSRKLGATGQAVKVSANAVQFEMDLSAIRLHGVHNVACLALTGQREALTTTARDFWHRIDASERLVFFLCLTPQAYVAVQDAVPIKGALRLSPKQVENILHTDEPRRALIEQLRQQYALRQLVPFNCTQPVDPHMFFGRQAELDLLRYEPKTSFAIAGPGRLGKTSLGKQFHHLLAVGKDARTARKYRVDFYACEDHSSDAVARHLAINIDPSKRSDRVRTEDLNGFLKYQVYKHNGPLELLLDELDEVCHARAFEVLTQAARDGLCRLILCGRGKLFKAVTTENSPLKGRVEIIRLKPLEESEARGLLMEPLIDLGIELEQPEKLIEQVFHWTGRLPHLVQYYGKRLVAQAISTGTGKVTPKDIDLIRGEFETAQIFLEQLEGLSDEHTRRLALALIKDGRRYFTVPMVQEVADQHDLVMNYHEVLELCNQLVIDHVLAWGEEAFQLANYSLGYYARKMRWQERHGKIEPGPYDAVI